MAIALAAAIIGAGVAVGVLYGSGRLDGPTFQYNVSVYLKHDVTADEKMAIEAALSEFHPSGGVTFESREQAFKNWQEMSKDLPEKPAHGDGR
jgi:cell division protein FtsX